jgi:hypothetical protein
VNFNAFGIKKHGNRPRCDEIARKRQAPDRLKRALILNAQCRISLRTWRKSCTQSEFYWRIQRSRTAHQFLQSVAANVEIDRSFIGQSVRSKSTCWPWLI